VAYLTHFKAFSLDATYSYQMSRYQFLLLRNFGMAVSLLGGAVAIVGLTGIQSGPSIAALATELVRNPDTSAFGCCAWLRHWRLWGIGIACGGSAIALAGAALALGKRWGFLLLGSILAFAAIAPWVIQALQLTKYPYERAGLTETLVYLALSLLSAWGYLRYSGEPDKAGRLVGYPVGTVVAVLALGNLALFFGLTVRDKLGSTDGDDCDKAYWDWNDTDALKRCETAAKSGDANAQFGYGLILWSDPPWGVDRHAALEWLTRSELKP
jgi:hypothetical protein